MQLKIRDLVFPIESAQLSGGMADPYWSAKWDRGSAPMPRLALEINAAPIEHEETDWQPKLYHDWLTFPSRNWRDIGDRKLIWRAEHDPYPSGAMYVFEHASIHEAELSFGKRTGLSFEIEWRGMCDIFWDQNRYGQRVPFEATAIARFADVILNGSARDDEASFRKRFAFHFNVEDFDQSPIASSHGDYEDGMAMLSCRFTPRAEREPYG